jgi:DtxR family Mn-dependent transcriptional regulator
MTDPRPSTVTDEMLEDCLQALQRLAQEGRPARVEAVAAFARLSDATTGAVLDVLVSRDLLRRDGSGDLVLTREGGRQAAGVLRRHRLSERLFTDVLGLPWDRAHEEAMRMEHGITPDGEARLAQLLDHPETCPHGAPIPSIDGTILVPNLRPLDGISVGSRVWIQQIVNEEREFLHHLASLGLLPGTEIRVEEVAPFGGPLLIRVGGAQYAVGRDVAGRILVRDTAADDGGPRRTRRRSV